MAIYPRFQVYKSNRGRGRQSRGILRRVIYLYILTVAMRLFLVQFLGYPVGISSAQMNPELLPGDRVVVSPLAGWFARDALKKENKTNLRGRIVAVRIQEGSFNTVALELLLDAISFGIYPTDIRKLALRRIIAFEYERISMNTFEASIFTEDSSSPRSEFELIDAAYSIRSDLSTTSSINAPYTGTFDEIRVPEGHVFVLSDNRKEGLDSRYWSSLPISSIRSLVVFRYWPIHMYKAY